MTFAIEKLTIFAVVLMLSLMILNIWQRHDTIAKLTTYGASDLPDSVLVGDFAVCLKQQPIVLPLPAVGCGGEMTAKYGPAAFNRIDVVAKALSL